MVEVGVSEEILNEVKKTASDGGKISCPKARRLAKELGVSPKLVGKACDELGIKIKDCELGCF